MGSGPLPRESHMETTSDQEEWVARDHQWEEEAL